MCWLTTVEETINNSKKLALKKTVNIIHFPWRDKKLKRRFHWTEFIDPKLKKIILENVNVSGNGQEEAKGRIKVREEEMERVKEEKNGMENK